MLNNNKNMLNNYNNYSSVWDYEKDSIEDDNFAVVACFTRSLDEFHLKNERVHLISSICLLKKDQLNELYQNINNLSSGSEENFFVFKINNTLSDDTREVYENLYIINLSIYKLLCVLGFTNLKNDLFDNLFGDSRLNSKDVESICSNSLFIFENEMWSNILLNFKINNVAVSGGSISKRHVIHTVELQLILILLRLFGNENKVRNIFYQNYNNSILSSSIPLEYYENFLEFKDSIKELKVSEIMDDSIKIFEDSVPVYKDLFKPEKLEFKAIIKSNLKLAISLLIRDIGEGINNNIKNITVNIEKLKSRLNILKFDKENIEGIQNISTKYMSNKQKKIFKKDRTEILKSNTSAKLKQLNKEINYLELDIKKKEAILNNQKNERDDILKNIYGYTVSKLDELQKENSSKFNKSRLVKRTPRLQNQNTLNLNNSNNIGIRQYHSINHRYFSTDNANNKINFVVNSPIYIELQRILHNSPLNEDTQIKIEQFLHNQGSLLLKMRMEENLDVNYSKINPFVLNHLKKSMAELKLLISNYKLNLLNSKNNKNESELILSLEDEVIISQLFGRLIRIISNHNLSNNNTNCVELASDLGQSLLNYYYLVKFEEWVESKCGGTLSLVNYSKLCVDQPIKKNFYNQWLKDQQSLIRKTYSLSKFIEANYSDFNNSMTDMVLIKIGLNLLNLLEEVNLVYSDTLTLSKDKKINVCFATEKIIEGIGKGVNLLNLSYRIPMIVPPKAYSRINGKDILGGFLLNDKLYIDPVIIKNPELKEQSNISDKNIILDVINKLSSVGYKINIPVLEFLLEYGLKYELFTDPNFIHPLEIKKNNKEKLTLLETKKLDSFLSRKQLEINIFGLALIFKNVPEFFIPVRIDNRGRIYCMVDYLNYQGIELAKALLLFSRPEKVLKCNKESIDYLKIFGANCYGNGIDKKSYNDRVDWVNQNEEDILNFKNGKLIKEADSKLLFIAFCFEYINYHNSLLSEDTFYLSNFPIQLDATCNGYQHLSLLTGDECLAKHLNLISGDKNSIPQDFYTFVSIKLSDYLKNILSEEKKKLRDMNEKIKNSVQNKLYEEVINNIRSCENLLNLKLNRSILKHAIMVKPYNASLMTMVDYVKEHFEKEFIYKDVENILNKDKIYKKVDKVYYKDKSSVKLENKDLFFLLKTMDNVIYNEFPKLKELNTYLAKIAEICSELKLTIAWVLPNGLNVNQHYIDTQAVRLKPFKYRKNTFTIKIAKDKPNKMKQIKALMPNLIHSLDAASLSLIMDMFYQDNQNDKKKINFFSIHDCFAVTANNIPDLIQIIKLVYIKIYSDDNYLKRFDEGIRNIIKLHFGDECFNENTNIIKVENKTYEYPDVDLVILGRIKACKIMRAQSIIN